MPRVPICISAKRLTIFAGRSPQNSGLPWTVGWSLCGRYGPRIASRPSASFSRKPQKSPRLLDEAESKAAVLTPREPTGQQSKEAAAYEAAAWEASLEAAQIESREVAERDAYRAELAGYIDERMVFDSFRHTFKQHARLAGILEGVQRQIMGHSSSDTADEYGSG